MAKIELCITLPMSPREEFTGVVARAVVELSRDIESLRGRMSVSERQAPCRVHRDIEGLFESLLSESFGGENEYSIRSL